MKKLLFAVFAIVLAVTSMLALMACNGAPSHPSWMDSLPDSADEITAILQEEDWTVDNLPAFGTVGGRLEKMLYASRGDSIAIDALRGLPANTNISGEAVSIAVFMPNQDPEEFYEFQTIMLSVFYALAQEHNMDVAWHAVRNGDMVVVWHYMSGRVSDFIALNDAFRAEMVA